MHKKRFSDKFLFSLVYNYIRFLFKKDTYLEVKAADKVTANFPTYSENYKIFTLLKKISKLLTN